MSEQVKKGDMLQWSRPGAKPWYGIVVHSDTCKILVKWMRKNSTLHTEDYTVEVMADKLSNNYFNHYPRRTQ